MDIQPRWNIGAYALYFSLIFPRMAEHLEGETLIKTQVAWSKLMLFDLKDDPGETVDRARKRPRARKQAEAELLDWRSLLGLPDIHGPLRRRPVPRLDPEAHERLRELGYVE